MTTTYKQVLGTAAFFAVALAPMLAHASVESSLMGLKNVLISGILPIIAVIALGYSGFQFFVGNPNAKQHFIFAISGVVILFLAQSIVDLLSRVVR
jgi:type IV secretory pathway VirB2 component (pilin)